MIGRSLNQRYGNITPLSPEAAVARLEQLLALRAEDVVRVRAEDARAVACCVVDADEGAVRACRTLGLDMKPGGTAVFGLLGADAAKTFTSLPPHQRGWLETPCAPRETKVLLLAGGIALLSLVTEGGKVRVSALA